ncbi:hypothetical protein ACFL3G_05005 [Planctomycetota bacterium]
MDEASDSIVKFNCENCNRTIRVSKKHAGKKGKCPKCKSIIVVPQGNLADTKEPDLDPSLFDIQPKENNTVDEQLRVLYGGRTEPEQTQQATRRRLPWLIDILLYPTGKPGLIILGIIIGLPLLIKLLTRVMQYVALAIPPFYVFAVLLLPVSIFVNITVALYLYWYLAFCVRDSAEGNLRAPDVLAGSASLGEMFWQLGKLLACFIFFILLIYLYIAGVKKVDLSFGWFLFSAIFLIPIELPEVIYGDIVFQFVLFCIVFLFPMTLLAVVMFDSLSAFNPILIIGSVFKTFFQYVGLVLLFCGICVPIVITRRIVSMRSVSPAMLILPYIARAASIYLLMVGAHILGRFYWRYQEKLNWEV